MKLCWLICSLIACGCSSRAEPSARVATSPKLEPIASPAEAALGVADRGIFSDVEARLRVEPPAEEARLSALIDSRRKLLVLYADGWPRKVYPLGGPALLEVGGERLALRAGDRAELSPLLERAKLSRLEQGDPPPGDRDGDGIPDPLDVLIGAHKAALNGDHYDDRYFTLTYPNGDPPRDRGACVDVVVRAARNAGLDLQSELFDDIRRAPSAYGKARPDPNIDHRRVRSVLVYFRRHWQERSPALDDPKDPLRVGDVVLLDTLPRPGPDHIGVVSELIGDSKRPLIINNWTFGYTTRPMDLLGTIPVTHRFRFPSQR